MGKNAGEGQKGDVVGGFYRSLNQDEDTDKIFYKQMGEVSQLLGLVLMGNLNLLALCWKHSLGCS